MKHIKLFEEYSRWIDSPVAKLLIEELDKLGISWRDDSTDKQKKNGTIIISLSLKDSIDLLFKSDIPIRFLTKQKLSLLNSHKEILEKFFDQDKIVNEVEDIIESDNLPYTRDYRMSWIFYARGFIGVDFSNRPVGAQKQGVWDPNNVSQIMSGLAEVFNRIRINLISTIEKIKNYFLRTNEVDLSDEIILKLIDIITLELGGGEIPMGKLRNINLSQESFSKLIKNPRLNPQQIFAIHQNPHFNVADDILGEW